VGTDAFLGADGLRGCAYCSPGAWGCMLRARFAPRTLMKTLTLLAHYLSESSVNRAWSGALTQLAHYYP